MKKTLIATAIGLAALFAGTASAWDRVRLLGVSTLSDREGDRDYIDVSCRPRLAAIKLRSVGGTAEVRRVALTYGNGERDVVRVRDILPPGDETGWIDLTGYRRCVTSITVVGDAQLPGERYRGGRVAYDPRYDRDPRHDYDRDYDRGYGRGYGRGHGYGHGRRMPYAQIEVYGRY